MNTSIKNPKPNAMATTANGLRLSASSGFRDRLRYCCYRRAEGGRSRCHYRSHRGRKSQDSVSKFLMERWAVAS
jgi:hypothetical protein